MTRRSSRCDGAYAFGDYTFGVSEWERRKEHSTARLDGKPRDSQKPPRHSVPFESTTIANLTGECRGDERCPHYASPFSTSETLRPWQTGAPGNSATPQGGVSHTSETSGAKECYKAQAGNSRQ